MTDYEGDPRREIIATTLARTLTEIEFDGSTSNISELYLVADAILDLIETDALDSEMDSLEDWEFEVDLMSPKELALAYRRLTWKELNSKDKRAEYIVKKATEFSKTNKAEWQDVNEEIRREYPNE